MSCYYPSQAQLRHLGFALLLDPPAASKITTETKWREGWATSALTFRFPHLANGEMLPTPQRYHEV